jgi:hypothetical protein
MNKTTKRKNYMKLRGEVYILWLWKLQEPEEHLFLSPLSDLITLLIETATSNSEVFVVGVNFGA